MTGSIGSDTRVQKMDTLQTEQFVVEKDLSSSKSSQSLQETSNRDTDLSQQVSTSQLKSSEDDQTPTRRHHTLWAATIERNQFVALKYIIILAYGLYYFQPELVDKWINLQHRVVDSSLLWGYGSSGAGEPNTGVSGSQLTELYHIGPDDVYFVLLWIVKLTFLRSAVMNYVCRPLAEYGCGITSQKALTRFAERGWLDVYYISLFSFGVYLYLGSPYYMQLDNLYSAWPHDEHTGLFKKYYLVTIAFWVQQFFVLNIEERRKDHYQMFLHHVVTFCLVVGSYYYHFTRIGHLIIMIMDLVDITLDLAKMLKYLGYLKLCDLMFVVFLVSWIILRHGVYNVLFWHAWTKASDLMADGQCGAPGNNPNRRCWTPMVLDVFYALLGGLQLMTCVWMYFISKVAYRVVSGYGADDVRSDEDDTDLEGEEEVKNEGEIEAEAESQSSVSQEALLASDSEDEDYEVSRMEDDSDAGSEGDSDEEEESDISQVYDEKDGCQKAVH